MCLKMFKQTIKIKSQNMKVLLMRCKRKTNKKLWIVISCRRIEKCTVKNEKQKIGKHKKEAELHYTIYFISEHFVLDQSNVAKVHNYVSFSCKRCFLMFPFKEKCGRGLLAF